MNTIERKPPRPPKTVILSDAVKKAMEIGVEFELEAEQEESQVHGNALSSGDPKLDRRVENKILKRLDEGDVWAWASVTVTARFGEFEGHDYLGGCCYKDEHDFMTSNGSCYDPATDTYTYGSYYTDMCDRALEELQEIMHAALDSVPIMKLITEL